MSFSIRVFFDNRFLTKKILFFSPPIIRSDFYISKTRDGRIGKEFASSFFVGREAYRELRWLTSFLRPTSESKTKSIGVFSSSWIDSGHTPDGRRRILATYILSRFLLFLRSPLNDYFRRKQELEHLNLGHFFFLSSQGISLSNIEIGFQWVPKKENAREINHTFTAPFMSRHKRLLKRYCSLHEEYFPGKQKISFFLKSSYSLFLYLFRVIL